MDFSSETYSVRITDYLNEAWGIMERRFFDMVVMGLLIIAGSIVPFANWVLEPCLTGGFIWIVLNLLNGKDARFDDMLRGFDWFVALVFAGVILKLLTLFALALCLLPVLAVKALYIFTFVLIVDQNLDFWTAMETSRKKVQENFWGILGLLIIIILIHLVGLMCCGVGVVITRPFVLVLQVVAYRDIFQRA